MKIENTKISFREMKQDEEADVIDLVLNTFSEFVAPHFSQEGVLEFKKFVNESSLNERFQSGNLICVALYEKKLVGAIEIRDINHIALLFVTKEHQQKGIAKRLIYEALKMCRKRNPRLNKITVNSSPNAYSAYQKIGFKGEKAIKTNNGIRFIPLELELSHDDFSQQSSAGDAFRLPDMRP